MPALGAVAAVAVALLVWVNPLTMPIHEPGERSSPIRVASRISLAGPAAAASTPTPLPYTWRQ